MIFILPFDWAFERTISENADLSRYIAINRLFLHHFSKGILGAFGCKVTAARVRQRAKVRQKCGKKCSKNRFGFAFLEIDGRKIFSNFFEKTLDFPRVPWYNIITERERNKKIPSKERIDYHGKVHC